MARLNLSNARAEFAITRSILAKHFGLRFSDDDYNVAVVLLILNETKVYEEFQIALKSLRHYGLCPICGKTIYITGETSDGRLIGSCFDAFTTPKWMEESENG